MNGLVLAGGQSTRMGKDKSMLAYHGIPQYVYVYELLKPFCKEVFISAKEDKYTLPTLIDSPKYSDMGPIAGFLTAYEYASTDWLVIAIDYPRIGKSEILPLLEPTDKVAHVYFNPETGFYEPFLGYYKEPFGIQLVNAVNSGGYSIQKILQNNTVHKIVPMDLEIIRSVDFPIEP